MIDTTKTYNLDTAGWIEDEGFTDLIIMSVKLGNDFYDIGLKNPKGEKTNQRIYITEKALPYFDLFVRKVCQVELPKQYEERDEGLVEEMLLGAKINAQLYKDKSRGESKFLKIDWRTVSKLTDDVWSIMVENAKAKKPIDEDDINF